MSNKTNNLNLVSRKRTAIDGKSWWCVWDKDTKSWTNNIELCGKFKTKKDCEYAIKKYELWCVTLTENINIKQHLTHRNQAMSKPAAKNTKKIFTVNVHYQMTHTMEVEAEDEEQAKAIAEENFGDEDFCNDDFDYIVDSCVCNPRF